MTDFEKEVLDAFHKLTEENQAIFIAELDRYIKNKERGQDSAAA